MHCHPKRSKTHPCESQIYFHKRHLRSTGLYEGMTANYTKILNSTLYFKSASICCCCCLHTRGCRLSWYLNAWCQPEERPYIMTGNISSLANAYYKRDMFPCFHSNSFNTLLSTQWEMHYNKIILLPGRTLKSASGGCHVVKLTPRIT